MRLAYGEGVIFSILVPFVLYLFGIGRITILETLFSVFALIGLWTIISAFLLMGQLDRIYYLSWGLVILSISSAFIVHLQYAIGLILIALIVSLLLNIAMRKDMQKPSNVSATNARQAEVQS